MQKEQNPFTPNAKSIMAQTALPWPKANRKKWKGNGRLGEVNIQVRETKSVHGRAAIHFHSQKFWRCMADQYKEKKSTVSTQSQSCSLTGDPIVELCNNTAGYPRTKSSITRKKNEIVQCKFVSAAVVRCHPFVACAMELGMQGLGVRSMAYRDPPMWSR